MSGAVHKYALPSAPNSGNGSSSMGASEATAYSELIKRIKSNEQIPTFEKLYPLWILVDITLQNALKSISPDLQMNEIQVLNSLLAAGIQSCVKNDISTLLIACKGLQNKFPKSDNHSSLQSPALFGRRYELQEHQANVEAIIQYLEGPDTSLLLKGIFPDDQTDTSLPIDVYKGIDLSVFSILRTILLTGETNKIFEKYIREGQTFINAFIESAHAIAHDENLFPPPNTGSSSTQIQDSLRQVLFRDVKMKFISYLMFNILDEVKKQSDKVFEFCLNLSTIQEFLDNERKQIFREMTAESTSRFYQTFWDEYYDFLSQNISQFSLVLNEFKKNIECTKKLIRLVTTSPDQVYQLLREHSHKKDHIQIVIEKASSLQQTQVPDRFATAYSNVERALDHMISLRSNALPNLTRMQAVLEFLKTHHAPTANHATTSRHRAHQSLQLQQVTSVEDNDDDINESTPRQPSKELSSQLSEWSGRLTTVTDTQHFALMNQALEGFISSATPNQRLFYASSIVKEGYLIIERILTKMATENGTPRDQLTHDLLKLANCCKKGFSFRFLSLLQTLGKGEIDTRNCASFTEKEREKLATLSKKVLHSAHHSSQGKDAPLNQDLFTYISTVITVLNHILQHKTPDQYVTRRNLEDQLSSMHTSYTLALSRTEKKSSEPHPLASSLEKIKKECEKQLRDERIPYRARQHLENIVNFHIPACKESLTLSDHSLLQASSFFSSYHWLLENLFLATIHFNRAQAPSSSEHNLALFADKAGISLDRTERAILEQSNQDRSSSRYHFANNANPSEVQAQIASATRRQKRKERMEKVRGNSSAGAPSLQESFDEEARKKIALLKSLLAKCQASWK